MNEGVKMFKIGDHVVLKPEFSGKWGSQVWVVQRFLQVNMRVTPLGGGRGLRGRPEIFQLALDGDDESVTNTPYVPMRYLNPGEVVTVTGVRSTKWNYDTTQRFVIVSQTTPDRVKIAKLGGDAGRTWTISRSSCTAVQL